MITYKGRQIPDTFEEIVDPKHTALIVHEMLNDFCHKDGAYSAAIPDRTLVQDLPGLIGPTVNLVNEARKAEVKVIYVGWTNYPDNSSRSDPEIQAAYESIMDGTYIMQRCLFEGTWGHEVIDELKPQEGDLFLNKYKRDAFAGTSLDSILQWNGIRTFIIVGIGVHVGIVPTVSNGVNKGYFVVVPEDCMISNEPEWLDTAMKFLRMWAIAKPSSELIKAWKG
ncbi:MAG: cysteine hydrolase [Dehalococcoidia bacterium]